MGVCLEISLRTHLCSLFLGKSKEAEIKRINKELANIRSKFKGKCVMKRSVVNFVYGRDLIF